MKKQHLISLGLVIALSATAAMAETTIYTDGIGRMHFLGKDPGSNSQQYNYSNSEEQDLTRKLYSEGSSAVNYDSDYDQHPVKNYNNTFSDSRYDTTSVWKNKFTNNVDEARVRYNGEEENRSKTVLMEKTSNDALNYTYSEGERNVIKNTKPAKKHWWNRKK